MIDSMQIQVPRTGEPVVLRFFEAMNYLKQNKVVHGLSTITSELGIDRRNLYKVKQEPDSRSLHLSWLTGLVVKYNVSPRWLLTGEGNIIDGKA